ncbi:MAG: anaerobic sulfatase maturase [Eubacteriales bacterium]
MQVLSLLIKPASGNCNMRCKYCFYVDEMNNRSVQNLGIMTEETLYNVLKTAFDSVEKNLSIAFQGGEPTLAGFPYFQKVVELVKELNTNQIEINYAIQTNGYILDDTWAMFFKEHKFLVGISLDGNKEVHDKYRIDARGEGTFDRVMASIDLLKKYEVDFNILTVVHADTTKSVNQMYNFFKRNDFGYQQYIECLDPIGEVPGGQEYSLTPEKYGEFLIALFKKFYRDLSEGKYVYIRYFENLVGILLRHQPESCAMQGRCGEYLTIEADGSAYPCDFYVLDEWKLGNFNTDTIEQMEQKRKELEFVEHSMPVPDECKECKWYPLCRNACRRNCEPTSTSHRGVNYFCKSYKMFFEYAYPYFEDLYRMYGGK